jgi:hypothetical protein
VFEIREYLDGSGATVKHDMVDVTAQLESMSTALDQKRGQVAAMRSGAEQGLEQDVLKRQETILDALREGLMGTGSPGTGAGAPGLERTDVDEGHLDFIKELSEIHDTPRSRRSTSSTAGFASASVSADEQAARARIRAREKALHASQANSGGGGAGADGGWKKGFLDEKPVHKQALAMPRKDSLLPPPVHAFEHAPIAAPVQPRQQTAYSHTVVEKQTTAPPPLSVGPKKKSLSSKFAKFS